MPAALTALLPAWVWPILLLALSNLFMNAAWYGHLKFKAAPLWIAILASWSIALVEYVLAVPANRYGHAVYSVVELKTIQEVMTLVTFVLFSTIVLKEQIGWSHLVGFGFIAFGAWIIFRAPALG